MLDPLLVLRLQLQSNRFRRKPGEIHQGTLRRGTERPAAALSVVEFSAGKAGGDPDAALRSGFGEAPALFAGAAYRLTKRRTADRPPSIFLCLPCPEHLNLRFVRILVNAFRLHDELLTPVKRKRPLVFLIDAQR